MYDSKFDFIGDNAKCLFLGSKNYINIRFERKPQNYAAVGKVGRDQ